MTASMQLNEIIGKEVLSARSSLTSFCVSLEGGVGLLIEAGESEPGLKITVANECDLPKHEDAVCKVDWQWISKSKIEAMAATPFSARLKLTPAGPLTISVQLWQGKPFLAFQPFRPAS
jgi:hypothetical protein